MNARGTANPLVTPSWLAERLRSDDLIILDATLPAVGAKPSIDVHEVRARYRARHIPGAVFFDIEELSDHSTTLPHMLPGAEEFSINMSVLGVGHSMDIVVYEQADVFAAPRAWWMLRSFGAQRAYVLDGGLQAWLEAGYPTEAGEIERPAASFSASLNSSAVKDFNEVKQMIAKHAQIVDARSAARFSGATPEPRAGIASGHMPGAMNVPFTEIIEQGRLKSAESLREIFGGAGVDFDRPVTTTCGSGVTAAVLSLALAIAGAKDVSLYDGSWAEYAQRPEAVIERTK